MRSSIRVAVIFASFLGVVAGCSSSDDRVATVMPSRPASAKENADGLAAQLGKDTGVTWFVTSNEEYGTPSFVEPKTDAGVVLAPGADAEAVAREWLKRYAQFYGIDDVAKELEVETIEKNLALGLTHVAFRQVHRGVRVDATRVTMHFDRAGHLAFVNSTFAPRAREVATAPAIDVARATDIARAAFGKTTRPMKNAPSLLVEPHARKLLWRVSLSATNDARVFDVDALTGAVLASRSAFTDATVTLTVTGNRMPYDIEIDAPEGGEYALRRGPDGSTRPPMICGDGRIYSTYRSADGEAWDDAAGDPDPRAAVDAYANLTVVESWYRTQLSWSSYDNQTSPLFVWMHACPEFNAKWNTVDGEMLICDGAAATKTASMAAAVDIVAHEMQHGITASTLGLTYQNQSGALNESLSDVFGSLLESATGTGDGHWIGENAASPPLRDMREPTSLGHVDRMSEFREMTEDNGGVHYNSGIPNKAFMLFTEGGRHASTSIAVNGPVGPHVSRDVYWELVRGRAVGQDATIEEFALAHSAIARRTGDEVLRASVCAWRAVEVFDDETTKSRWELDCDPHESCLAGTHPCAEGKRCAWNGEETGYCCRTPRPGSEETDLCLADSDCPAGKICSYGRDNLLMCQDPERGDDTCQRPPGSATP